MCQENETSDECVRRECGERMWRENVARECSERMWREILSAASRFDTVTISFKLNLDPVCSYLGVTRRC